jgi:hypothetical protein
LSSELDLGVVVALLGDLGLVVEAVDLGLDVLDLGLRLGGPGDQAHAGSQRESGHGSDESLPTVEHERAVSLTRRTPTG